MTVPHTLRIRGAALKVGDEIVFLGRIHRIYAIAPYRHPSIPAPARIARGAGSWAMTVFDADWIEIAA